MKKTYCDVCGIETEGDGPGLSFAIDRGLSKPAFKVDDDDVCVHCRVAFAEAIERCAEGLAGIRA